MKNLKIGKKLLLTFGIIILVFLITVTVNILGLNFGGSQFQDFYEYSYPLSEHTLEIRRGIQTSIKALGLSMLTEDAETAKSYVAEVEAEMKGVQENFDYLIKNYRGDPSRLNQALDMLTEAKEYRLQIQTLSTAGENAQASELFFNQYNPILREVMDMATEMDKNTTTLAEATYTSARGAQEAVTLLALGLSVAAVVLTVILAGYLTKSLTRPIFEIEAAAKQMAQGHLDVNIGYQSRDELGHLSENMRLMAGRVSDYMKKINKATIQLSDGDLNVDKEADFLGDFGPTQQAIRKLVASLNGAMTQLNQSADQVAAGSDQVSSGSQALSQGAAEQASSVEELAATVNEISQQVSDTAENAVKARERTMQAGEELSVCNQKMQKMIDAIGEITEKSSEIGKIIKTIEDIAFQTNILALNAAVEAARAGAAGKGFAVVADEVRNLASKSAEASKNTASLIEGTIKAVEHGTGIANDTAQSLVSVVDGAQMVSVLVNDIADAAKTQSVSIAQVTQGIDQISSVVQTNSATAEESAAASEELSGQAQVLRGLVGQFKLQSTEAAPVLAQVEPAGGALTGGMLTGGMLTGGMLTGGSLAGY